MGLGPTHGDENGLPSGHHSPWKRHPPLVIPSAVEGSAVLRTFRGNVFRQTVNVVEGSAVLLQEITPSTQTELSSRPER
jgi:hypothetical protein